MTDSDDLITKLPTGWTRATLNQCCGKVQDGSHFSPQIQYDEGGEDRYLYITAKNIKENRIDLANVTWVDRDFHDSIYCRCNPEKGDVLLIKDGVKTGIATVNHLEQPFSLLSSVALLKARKGCLNPYFLKHYLNSPTGFKATTGAMTGTAIRRIILEKLKTSTIPIPPLPEQHRIVSKIEELFTKLDAGVDELRQAKARLRRYRHAILKAAVTGELTQPWREIHQKTIEPASELMRRVSNDPCYQISDDCLIGLPQLPAEWVWTRLDRIADIKGGVTKNSKQIIDDPVTLPYLRVANVQRGYLDLSEMKYIEVPKSKVDDLLLKNGDILFTEGGDRDKLGRGWVWQGEIEDCTHQNHVFRARLHSDEISGSIISWFGNTFGQRYFLREGTQTTNLASINMTKLSAFPVPIPPVAEQKVILGEVERTLSVIEKLEAVVNEEIFRSNGLRQSILSTAFQGKLVPQNPGDEPAEKLFERIRQSASKCVQIKQKRSKNGDSPNGK